MHPRRHRQTRKRLRGGFFAPPPLVMVNFVKNASALVPATVLAGMRLFQKKTRKTSRKSKKTIRKITRRYTK
jgi:hypothetical protein